MSEINHKIIYELISRVASVEEGQAHMIRKFDDLQETATEALKCISDPHRTCDAVSDIQKGVISAKRFGMGALLAAAVALINTIIGKLL